MTDSIKNVNARNDLLLYANKFGSEMPFAVESTPEEWTPDKARSPVFLILAFFPSLLVRVSVTLCDDLPTY